MILQTQALALLGLAEGASREQIRSAYVREAIQRRLDDDAERFVGLREAYDMLCHGEGAASGETTAARDALTDRPDDIATRWRLLADLRYDAGPEAAAVLRDGAERQPDAFLDELMFYFPDRVPPALARSAREGASTGRLLLLADVHATAGHPEAALEALRTALAPAGTLAKTGLLKLALRPFFSLQMHAQTAPAREALAIVRAWNDTSVGRAPDMQADTMFQIALELAALAEAFPLDLRQVAAGAAKRGNFENARYEAKFATRLLKAREISKLIAELKLNAPVLAGLLRLDLTEEQLRPAGTPVIKIPIAWGTLLAIFLLYAAVFVHDIEKKKRDDQRFFRDVTQGFIDETTADMKRTIERDCADPDSVQCRRWRAFFSDDPGHPDGGRANDLQGLVGQPWPDAGLRLEDLGTIGIPETSRSAPSHSRKSHR